MNHIIALVVAMVLVLSVHGQEWLSLINLKGVAIEARVLQLKGDRVQLMGRNGKTYVIPVAVLSPESRKLIVEQAKPSSNAPSSVGPREQSVESAFSFEQMNETFTQPLFKDFSLWDDDPVSYTHLTLPTILLV